jgi:hypothetical protein
MVMAGASSFVCPHWRPGEACRRYIHVSSWKRLLVAVLGSSIGVAVPTLNFLKTLSNPPAGALLIGVIAWGIVILLVWLTSIVITMHQEHDMWGNLIAAFGTPSLFTTAITMPQLFAI